MQLIDLLQLVLRILAVAVTDMLALSGAGIEYQSLDTGHPVKFLIMSYLPVAKNCNVTASHSSGDISLLHLVSCM